MASGQEESEDKEPGKLATRHWTLATSYAAWITQNRDTIAEMKRLEEENNRLFIDAYGLGEELTPDVPIEQITLTVNPAYRYGKKVPSGQWSVASGFGEELEARFREDTMEELVSYAIGCMMGRYRLDRPGLIYAHSGNERFWEIYDAEEVASGQWLVASKMKSDESEKLQGIDRLAESHAAGGTSLSGHAELPAGRNLRVDQSTEKGGGVNSIKHSGGAGSTVNGGIQELPLDSPGIAGGSGNTVADCQETGIPESGAATSGHDNSYGSEQNDTSFGKQTSHWPLATNHFPPDGDGIVPLTDTEWFDDDAAHRLVEFIDVAFNRTGFNEHTPSKTSHSPLATSHYLEANLTFLADNLSPKKNESSRETLRRYLCDSFFKDHLQTYKKRPIYWLFGSGKQKAFQCLVYLHRYNEGTLSRMRTEYVIPLQGKMAHRIDSLREDIASGVT